MLGTYSRSLAIAACSVTATLQQQQSHCQEHKQKGQEVKCDLWATVRRKPRAPQSTSGDTQDISQQLLRDSCMPR